MGEPSGIIIQAEGKTIYHAGDTAYFSDLGLLAEEFDIDVAFLPIGDNYTMGPEDAARAAQTIRAKKVVPIHYNTFPVIEQAGLDKVLNKFVIGAMTKHAMERYITPGSLMIVGNRAEVQ